MGAWGVKNFENDDAYDWLNIFLTNPVRTELEDVFNFVLDQRDYLSNQVSQAALAAAELVAARLGHASEDFPDDIDIDSDLIFVVDEVLIEMASRVTNRIHYFAGRADARELWQDAGATSYREWEGVLADLMKRLQY